MLRVDQAPAAFEPLVSALSQKRQRVGWLELEAASAVPSLDAAAQAGVLRAVAVGGGRCVAVKRLRRPVLRDLLREHFSGCALVLVRVGGAAEPPPFTLQPTLYVSEDRFEIATAERRQSFDLEALVASLGRSSTWWWR